MGKILASYKRLFDSLAKKKTERIYFLYGNEEYLKKEFVSGLIKKILPEESGIFNLDIFYGDEFDKHSFDDRVSSFPLFSSNRIVIVKNFDALPLQSKDFVLEKIRRIPDSLTVVIESSADKMDNARLKELKSIADSQGTSFAFKHLSEEDTIERLKSRIRKEEMNITDDALELMVESVGTQLLDLANEVDKLVSTAKDEKTITSDMVKQVVGRYRAESVFSLIDQLSSKDPERILKTLNALLDGGEEPVFILALLLRRVLSLMQVRMLIESGVRAQSLAEGLENPMSPYMVNVLMTHAGKFKEQELELLLDNLIWADIKIKTSQINSRTLIEEAILAFSVRKKLATFSS